MTSIPTPSRPKRPARLGFRATPEQEALLQRAAAARHKSLAEFVLDSACAAAEQTLLDQRLFMVPGSEYAALLELLDQPPQDNPGLQRLFAKPEPWDKP
ncbi:hypothetical protein MishRS11D_20130 [Methylomagnum ishizawai]|nr:hypothetical protein MishRS11D_20130 [Methylomagnum ishizawai]